MTEGLHHTPQTRLGRSGRRLLSCLLCVVSATSMVGPAQAAGREPAVDRVTAPLWRELGRPGRRRAHDLLEQAMEQVRAGTRQLPIDWRTLCSRTLAPGFLGESLTALGGRARALRELARQAVRKRAHMDNAVARLERAVQLDPNDPEVLYALGRVLMMWEQPGPLYLCSSQRRDEEATTALQKLRRLHPDFMAETVTFDLAVLLTRKARFADAARAYADAIALALDGNETAVMRANLAEVTMLAGDLEHAVEHYERALRIANGGRDYLLAQWGLCVALDRLGEHDAAQANAQKAIEAEAGQMQVLRSDGVFFEPEHEVYYYEALGHEALATRPGADRAQELTAAAASFRAFISAAGDTGAFTVAARASLERVQGELHALQPRKGARTKSP